jgi:hypothetical protein
MNDHSHIDCLAVDADIVCFRVAPMYETSSVEELHRGIDEFIYNIARNAEVNRMVFFLSDSSNFRYQIAKTVPYKHNRYDKNGNPKRPKPIMLPDAREYILSKYKGFIYPNHEADDCISSFMSLNEKVAHAGIDKDIKQIEGWHFDFVKNIWEYTSEEMSILLLWRQVCSGDTGDGIPGLPGIGSKKAAKAVIDPEYAKEQAHALYHERLKEEKTPDEITEYFNEQTTLIRMVDNLAISYHHSLVVKPPKIFDDHSDKEGAFMGFDEPKNKFDVPYLEEYDYSY